MFNIFIRIEGNKICYFAISIIRNYENQLQAFRAYFKTSLYHREILPNINSNYADGDKP